MSQINQMSQMGQMGQKGLGPPAANAVGWGAVVGCALPGAVDACVLLAARAYQGIVLSALSKVGLGKLLETEWDGGSAGCCRLLLHPLLPRGRGRFPGLPDRAAPGSLMGLRASLPGHPILIPLGG